MESHVQDNHLHQMETEIDGVVSACAYRDFDHYSNTPLLQHYLDLLKAEPSVSDLVQRARFSVFE